MQNRTKFRIMLLTSMALTLILISPLSAVNTSDIQENKTAMGYSIDLFPSIVSAADGKTGYALQAWAGIRHIKLRLVSAHLYIPDSMINEEFKNYEINVSAFIIDYVFSGNFSGFWIGSGMELWNSSIEHESSGQSRNWTDNVLTIGGGYIWKAYGNIYINPWAGIHYRTNDTEVVITDDKLKRERLSASVSVKIGYFFNI